jgi:hypothetical protein
MPRGGPPTYTYSLPAIYLAIPGTLITAAQHNTPLEDIASTLNTAWPVNLGGTGGTTEAALLATENEFTAMQKWAKGANIASASTLSLPGDGNYHHITGTTTVTAISTEQAGTWIALEFDAALTLTYNGTSLILPGSANITTAAGDTAVFVSEGSGNWRCVNYTRRNGGPVTGGSLLSVTYHTSSTTHNFNSRTRFALVEVQGGGAGAGTVGNTSGAATSGGGGAGGYTRKFFSTAGISSGTVVVGAGGASATNGGDSSWSDGTNTLTGSGGTASTSVTGTTTFQFAPGGAGGGASGGDVNINGAYGLAGASAGPALEGAGNASVASGAGGNSQLGNGGGGRTFSLSAAPISATGLNGTGRGSGGGGGAVSLSGGGVSGGAGTSGTVIVWEFA